VFCHVEFFSSPANREEILLQIHTLIHLHTHTYHTKWLLSLKKIRLSLMNKVSSNQTSIGEKTRDSCVSFDIFSFSNLFSMSRSLTILSSLVNSLSLSLSLKLIFFYSYLLTFVSFFGPSFLDTQIEALEKKFGAAAEEIG